MLLEVRDPYEGLVMHEVLENDLSAEEPNLVDDIDGDAFFEQNTDLMPDITDEPDGCFTLES